jgi:para-nitrobenzyl esterase
MRSARGLVHKAIIQSGPGVRCLSKDAASATARAILDELELRLPEDLEQLRAIPANALVAAAVAVQRRALVAGRSFWLSPVMDGITMAAHPFEPAAIDAAAKVPLLIGHTKDEGTFFIATDAKFGAFDEADLQHRAKVMAPGRADELIAALRGAKPNATPTELIADLFTATWAFAGSVTIAERKARQESAVFTYMLEWETPVVGGVLRATHALDLPMVFNNVETARAFVGPGKAPQKLADQMQAAWIAFAKTGNPNAAGLPAWPEYDRSRRATMIFNLDSRIEDDPWSRVRSVLVPSEG